MNRKLELALTAGFGWVFGGLNMWLMPSPIKWVVFGLTTSVLVFRIVKYVISD